MKKIILSILIITALFSTQIASAAFTDVDDSTPYRIAIDWLETNGVVEGYEDGTFKPLQEINRAEFLKMIYTTIGYSESSADVELPFPDVPEDEWYTIFVKEAYKTDVINGYPDGNFRPENPINKVEALKIVMNAFFGVEELYGDGENYEPCHTDLTENIYLDTNEWYWDYVYVADNLCIIPVDMVLGMQVYQFRPDTNLYRGQMAEFIYRAKTVKDWGVDDEYTPYSTQLAPSDL
ncbi:S-layer homology domain-containing protein [Patescibacteria group bacterium]